MVRLTKVPEERAKAVQDALQTELENGNEFIPPPQILTLYALESCFFLVSYLQQFPQLTSLSAIRIFFVFYADKSSEATLA